MTDTTRIVTVGLAVAFGFVGFDVVFGDDPATVDALVRGVKLFLVAVLVGAVADRRERLSPRF
jgi:hypothetical protein